MINNTRPKRRIVQAIRKYGVECRCCGEPRIEFLGVAEVAVMDGERHDNQFNYAWLQKNNYPQGFVTLCANCRQSFENLGFCPHQTQVKRASRLMRRVANIAPNDSKERQKIITQATLDERLRQYMNERWAQDPTLDALDLIIEYKEAESGREIPQQPNDTEMLDVLAEIHKTHTRNA